MRLGKISWLGNFAAQFLWWAAAILALVGFAQAQETQRSIVEQYLADVEAADLAPGATSFGEARKDLPIIPVLRDGETIAWAFATSDFVSTTGYSGKPIHILMAIDNDARITGVNLVKHSEPIVLIGIPNEKIVAVTKGYVGADLKGIAGAHQSDRKIDIISGATVTIMVIDDSIIRAGLHVARALELGGLKNNAVADAEGPTLVRDDVGEIDDWKTLLGDGSVRRLVLTNGEVNDAFAGLGDPRAQKRRIKAPADGLFAELNLALVSQPTIGRSLLGEAEYENLTAWLEDGEEAILIAGAGDYSYKGSGYVRGGVFDRIQLVQGDNSVRFRDNQYKRVGSVAAAGAPAFTEADIFKIPAEAGIDPAKSFRIELLVHRPVAAIEKLFTTFELDYSAPDRFLLTNAAGATSASSDMTHLWKRIWRQKRFDVALLAAAVLVLTGVFFFQMELTRNEQRVYWFRIAFLTFTLVFIGWHANAQLSVVNIFAFANAAMNEFSWSAFLMDPLIFILWFSVAASIIFWGRGAYCGWLCPFGALQELTNKVGRIFKIPQIRVPWGLHERLWPLKYIAFLALFGVSLYSLELAERYSEIEPFKTAIILKFARDWPFVLFAVALLAAGLFIERFYCRYLCPLGAALAIPGRMRMFDWLRRYRDCGNPCQRCSNECFVQAIHPEGHINPNECHQCLHCQVLYQSKEKCPVCIKKEQRREKLRRQKGPDAEQLAAMRPDPYRRLTR